MRTPMTAQSRPSTLTVLAMASLLLAGCAGEATAPSTAAPGSVAMAAPSLAAMALVGVKDGSYQFTIDPSKDQSLEFGPNHLDLPANSVCDLDDSGYGPDYWNRPCHAEKGAVTITAVVRNASSSHPSIQFEPAMRFNPDKNVELYIYAKHMKKHDRSFVMLYCTEKACVDEAQTDDLKTSVDNKAKMVFRRIKHFSGYVVAEFTGGELQL